MCLYIVYTTYYYIDSVQIIYFLINAQCRHLFHMQHTYLISVYIVAWVQTPCVTSVLCGIVMTVHVWACVLCTDILMLIKMWRSYKDPLSPEDICTVCGMVLDMNAIYDYHHARSWDEHKRKCCSNVSSIFKCNREDHINWHDFMQYFTCWFTSLK